jgi:IS5 family transposase
MTRTVRPAEAGLLPEFALFDALDRAKDTFLEKLDALVDWERFRAPLERAWPWTRDDGSAGRPSWDAVLMFKVLVVGKTKGNLSDESLEDLCRFHVRVIRFLRVESGTGPDAKTIHKYRSALARSGMMEKVFKGVEAMARDAGYQMSDGCMVDASLVPVPKRRTSRDERARVESGKEPDWSPAQRRQKDLDARWTKRGSTSHFGYKRHVVVDIDHKLIRASSVTPANVHDVQEAGLLDKVPKRGPVYGDRGYDSNDLRDRLKHSRRNACIAFRAPQQGEREILKRARKEANQSIAKVRARVEHVFGALQHDMGCRLHRGIGLQRARSELLLEHVVYNLRRLVHLERSGGPGG